MRRMTSKQASCTTCRQSAWIRARNSNLAIGLPDVVLCGIPLHPEHLVEAASHVRSPHYSALSRNTQQKRSQLRKAVISAEIGRGGAAGPAGAPWPRSLSRCSRQICGASSRSCPRLSGRARWRSYNLLCAACFCYTGASRGTSDTDAHFRHSVRRQTYTSSSLSASFRFAPTSFHLNLSVLVPVLQRSAAERLSAQMPTPRFRR